MKSIKIVVNENNCVSCRICQLICSSTFHSEFNPAKANIQITKEYDLTPTIRFTENCTQCGRCVQECLYGALTLRGTA